jgi:tetratricopeptide (TPR) repeat protein/DNA polymerase III delta prime subunit
MHDQDAKRDIFNFSGNLDGGVTVNNHPSPVRPAVEQNLLEAVRQWVESRLRGQLHHEVKLNLQKETQPQQVRPWGLEIKVAIAQPSQQLPPETTIRQVFDQCSGRLLILGEPGSGKTTSLLDLALELVERAETEPQQRIPVVVDLSDWQLIGSQSASRQNSLASRFPAFSKKNFSDSPLEQEPASLIANWLTNKVRERYGVPPKQIKQWLEDKRLVPLLDGLDEVRPEEQQNCVRALNQWLNSDLRPRQVALCCRREQYETYSEKLELEGAVFLQDLTDKQIQTFLSDVQQEELRESLVSDTNLLALIRRPLLLSIAVLAYKEIEPIQWRRATSVGDRLNLLLDAYMRRMLTQDAHRRSYRKGKIPNLEQSQKWLEVLALQLLQDSETELSIEQIQTTWLSTSLQKWLFSIFAVIVWGLISAAICWGPIGYLITWMLVFLGKTIGSTQIVWIGRNAPLWIGLGLGVFIGSLDGIGVLKDLPYIESSVENLQTSLPNLKPQKILRKLSSLKTVFISSKIIKLIRKIDELTTPPKWVFELITPKWIFNAEKWHENIKTLSEPNQGIWDLLKNIVPITRISLSLYVALIMITVWSSGIKAFTSPYSLFYTLLNFINVALSLWILGGGGYICIYHLIIRLSLSCTSSIPCDYTRFLDYATKRLLLQRVGGRYRFMHDLLRQSLAQRRIDTHPNLISPQIFFRCGESYRLMEQYDKALQNLNCALERDPKYKWALASRGRVYRAIHQYDKALQDFNLLIEREPRNFELIVDRASTYWSIKFYDKALQDFNIALKYDPQNSKAIAGRGHTYRLIENYEQALQDFNRAIELDPKYEWAIVQRGCIYRFMECYEQALQDFNRAIELDPKYESAIVQRGITYRLIDCYEEALQDFNRAIDLDPKYEWAIVQRGYAYYLTKRYEQALQDYNCAIKIDAKNDWCLYLRAHVYLILSQPDLANADLDAAIHFVQQEYIEKPENGHNIFNLALYHLVAGNLQTARGFYQTALQQSAVQTYIIRDAIQDLKDLLRAFPEQTDAQEMKIALEERLKLD